MQQLERKQQKPPRSSIPGRAREEQMPPKQMFKAWRSANDQICVVFQVTRGSCPTPAPPPSKDGRPGPRRDGSIRAYFHVSRWCHSATAVSRHTKGQMGEAGGRRKGQTWSTNAPSWDWGTWHGSLSRHGVIELMSHVCTGFRRLHVKTKKE